MRGQSTFLDFGTGFFLFLIVLLISGAYLSTRMSAPEPPDVLRISNELLTEGFPSDWNTSTIIVPGVLSNGSVDTAKWSNLSEFTPTELRELLFVSGDVYLRLVRYEAGGYTDVLPPIATVTTTYDSIPTLDHSAITTISRVTSYEGELVILEVIAWL